MSATSSGQVTINRLRRSLCVLGVVAASGLLTACASSGISGNSVFELRGASTAPVPGWTKSTNSDMPGSVVYVSPTPLLDASDVQRATAQKNVAGQAILLLQFSPAGTARLAAGTRELVGRQVAAVVDGRVTNMAIVQQPMSINTMALTGFTSFDEATRVAHLISSGK